MEKNFKHKILTNYCIIFYLLMVYQWSNGMFLCQLRPFLIYNRPDIFTWVFMQTHLPQWLLNNPPGWVLMDGLFYGMPLIYFLCYEGNSRFTKGAAVLMLLVNWCYVQCYTLYPSNSIEGHLAWLLFPVAFLTDQKRTFSLLFEGLRYFFLFFMVSAGIWKGVQGGIFHLSQMSGVLLYQHQSLLTSSPGFWQSRMILYLINHPALSYLFYLAAAVLELSFIVGFFTKKGDRILALAFVIFLLADYLLMRIPYFIMLPFVLTLLYPLPVTTGTKQAESSAPVMD